MSNRREPLSAAQQADLGGVVFAMRAAGLRWKEIMRALDRSRAQLDRYCRLHVAQGMRQNSPPMRHLASCDPPLAA